MKLRRPPHIYLIGSPSEETMQRPVKYFKKREFCTQIMFTRVWWLGTSDAFHPTKSFGLNFPKFPVWKKTTLLLRLGIPYLKKNLAENFRLISPRNLQNFRSNGSTFPKRFWYHLAPFRKFGKFWLNGKHPTLKNAHCNIYIRTTVKICQ